MDKITQMMVITMEECGELTQVCSKLLRKRHTRNEISDETKYKLTKEVADVMCMIELMKEEGLIEHHEIVKGIQEKRDKLKIWSNLIGH
jgi:NTP pyrophosphatase (non-canonical NTP hydrolase)